MNILIVGVNSNSDIMKNVKISTTHLDDVLLHSFDLGSLVISGHFCEHTKCQESHLKLNLRSNHKNGLK